MYYRLNNDKLMDYADFEYAENCLETDIITQAELDSHPNKVIVEEGVLILNPDYEAEEAQKEAERISHLKCTKRVLVLILEQLGFDYFEQIEPLINSNRQAKLEWELCVELERNNPLLNVIGAELGISPQQIDQVFKYANGEVETLAIMED